jgi:hypothetical protein
MRFSQVTSDAPCNQKDAGNLEQRLGDEAEPVIAECEALILQDQALERSTGQRRLPSPDPCG